MLPVKYYQIGGFRAHLRDYSNDALTAKLMTRDGVEAEFVLGIKPCGASYLLLPCERFRSQGLGEPHDLPRRASEYESLSPVQFATKADLTKKFAMLASNKKTPKGETPRDRSKANTQYTVRPNDFSEAGIARSSFEHQRVFYRLLQHSIERPLDYALNLAPRFRHICIYSFAFNTWGSDNRSLFEREEDPRIMDVGWTEFNAPTDSSDLTPVSTSHYVVEEERFLGNPGRKKLSLPDITQNMPRATITTRLQALLEPPSDGPRPPILFLVHDAKAARCALRSLGVDASRWRVGIKELLYSPHARGPPVADVHVDSKYDVRGHAMKMSRSRSRSPRRGSSSTDCGPRPRSPPAPPAPSVYLVDVRQMYHTLMQVPMTDTVLANSISLGVKDTAPLRGEDDRIIYEDVDLRSWCAGRESRLIGYMWEEMANSVAIDEQRALRHRFSEETPIHDFSQASGAPRDDDDVDPNDVIQPQSGGNGNGQTAVGGYDSASEDEW